MFLIPSTLSIEQILSLWMELEDAYRGENGYGGDTAEVYGYTLMPDSPTAHSPDMPRQFEEARKEQGLLASAAVVAICKYFEQQRNCRVYAMSSRDEGKRVGKWLLKVPIEHRIHLRVKGEK